MLQVFVYGTLKPGEENYPSYCQGKVIKEVKAYTQAKLYHLQLLGYPAMVLGKERVDGYLLTFADPEVLVSLDQLEDYDLECPKPHSYHRLEVPVSDLMGNDLGRAWAYFMTLAQVERFEGVWIPEGVWSRGNS